MKKIITIDTIFEGHQPSFHFGQKGQFLTSIGIDPDVPLTDTATDIKTSGVIRPVKYAKFSGSNVTAATIALINNPKNTLTYAVLSNGRLISYDSAFANETLIGTVTGGVATGAWYFNNYIYIVGTTDISRYGPLNNSPSLTNGVWTGATLGSQTALTNTTYPTTRNSVSYLSHTHHVHVDNKAYFLDYKNGQGLVHYIKTTKVTDEGDTNSSSAYAALTLPYNYLPFAVWGLGNDLVIAAAFTTDGTILQGPAKLFFWDTTSSTFYRVITLPDPLCTVLRYANGVMYGISGSTAGGVRLWRYIGGDSIQTLKYIEEGHPPLQNAADFFGNRLVWGTFTTYPENSASLMAYGSKSDLFPRGLHNIAVSSLTATSTNGVITAVTNAQQGAAFPKFIIGGTDGTNTNIDKQSTTYGTHVIRSEVFNIGRAFTFDRLILRLGQAVAANMTLTPKLYFDNESSSQAGTIINNTNYAASERNISQRGTEYATNNGKNNFYLELRSTGTALLCVLLPITIEIDIDDDEDG